MARKKTFTVGFEGNMKTLNDAQTGLQLWCIEKGSKPKGKYEWMATVQADTDMEALEIGQQEYKLHLQDKVQAEAA